MNAPSIGKARPASGGREMGLGTLIGFFALAFGLSWGIVALLLLFPGQIQAIFGEMRSSNPLFILAVYAPGLAGVLLVWRHYGLRGLGSFFGRLALWRMPLSWWAYLVIGIPALVYLSAALNEDGIEIALSIRSTEPIDALLTDYSNGLPDGVSAMEIEQRPPEYMPAPYDFRDPTAVHKSFEL